jgi:4-amino-4-deoxy-L-arabinose transferase-like glycosyltransferase
MQDLIFNTPWWLLLLLIGGGGYVWYTGNTRSEKSWKIGGIVLALLGITLAVTSWLVQTDKEYVGNRSRQIVAALDRRDWSALDGLLDPHTSLEGVYKNRDQIINGAKKTVDTIGLSSMSITSMDVKQTDTVITVDLNILSSQDLTLGRPTITSWRFDWENTGTGWKLVRIEPLPNGQISKEDIVQHLEKF